MEWPWPERATPAVLTWGGCHRRPRRSKMGLLDVCVRSRCLFPWSARSECRNATHTAGACARRLASERRPGALTASRWLVPGRHGGMIRPTLTGAAQDRAPGKQRLRQAWQNVTSGRTDGVARDSPPSHQIKTSQKPRPQPARIRSRRRRPFTSQRPPPRRPAPRPRAPRAAPSARAAASARRRGAAAAAAPGPGRGTRLLERVRRVGVERVRAAARDEGPGPWHRKRARTHARRRRPRRTRAARAARLRAEHVGELAPELVEERRRAAAPVYLADEAPAPCKHLARAHARAALHKDGGGARRRRRGRGRRARRRRARRPLRRPR